MWLRDWGGVFEGQSMDAVTERIACCAARGDLTWCGGMGAGREGRAIGVKLPDPSRCLG